MSTQRSNHHLHRHQLAQTPLPKGSSLPLRRLSSDLDSPYSRSNSPAPAFSTPLTSPSSTTTDWAIEQSNSTPSNYEIPLRTLYTNNVLALSNQTSSKPPSSSSSNKPPSPFSTQFSPVTESHSTTTQVAREHFRSCLMAQQSYIQSQPNGSLPPSFITSFVRRVFTEDLCLVDFTQALTGMDYLKALDDRRKRELSAALRRLNIDTSMADKDRQELISKNPAIWEWVASIEDKSKKAEALYTQVYIGLRRWSLINEMRLAPFNKPNCIAMLNTLYPPHYPAPPTSQLTDTILNAQRNAYFRYIQAVDKNGKSVLRNLENSNKRAGDHNGWSVVRDIVDVYLRKSNAVIEECISVKGPEDFETKKRADSGVSFGSSASHEKRPSTSHVTAHSPIYDKPLPAEPGCAPSSPKKQHSTFGRLARELRRIKSKSADSKDEFTKQQPLATKRSLRKMQSTSALNREANSLKKDKDGKHSRGNSSDRSALYEINDAQRQRLIQKARLEKEKENRTPSPPAPRRPLGLTALHTQQSSFVSQLSYSSQLSYGSSHPPSPPSAWGGQERTEYFTSKTFPPRREGNPYELPIEELMIAELP